jgi:hypothetical protein
MAALIRSEVSVRKLGGGIEGTSHLEMPQQGREIGDWGICETGSRGVTPKSAKSVKGPVCNFWVCHQAGDKA